jgi:hypothetical protein
VNIDSFSSFMYLVGSLLVFGSWVDIVPTGLGWIGWLIALAGWAVGHRRGNGGAPSTADEIAKLHLLRQQNVITDEEFDQQKQQLLQRR